MRTNSLTERLKNLILFVRSLPSSAVRQRLWKKPLPDTNDFVLKGVDKDFGKKVMLQTISYPPFYVGQERVGVHYCCGGLKFNEKAQVLNTSDEPIAGLYVAGEASGGVHGKIVWAVSA